MGIAHICAKQALVGKPVRSTAASYTDHEYCDIPYPLFAAWLMTSSLESDFFTKQVLF